MAEDPWSTYACGGAWDELLDAHGAPRPAARALLAHLRELDLATLEAYQHAAELAIVEMGITFAVYGEGTANIDRAWPFDILPRVIAGAEWDHVARGLRQRLRALNCFIADVYGPQRMVRDGAFPAELLAGSKNFRPQCVGVRPPHGVWAHVCGSDLVRGTDGAFCVLEDNLRIPSGVSYMLENREVMKRVFPELFATHAIRAVDAYPLQLLETLAALAPQRGPAAQVVVLTPGIYNSAYFEHAFLAQRMGAQLVEGRDLFVDADDCVYMHTIAGPARVDVIYRRVDDLFLDPEEFRPDSLLGVPGLMRAWRAGHVGLANAPGAGVADDKAVYAYVPDMIRYYLAEAPLLANVPTWLCARQDERAYVLDHLTELVVKPVNESGGYGLVVGPHATRDELAQCRARILADPANYVAQPVLTLSTCPTLCETGIAPRHVDLRPFVLQGERLHVTAGGLTRVAMRAGSLVVNSSQGGGSKDTWVVETGPD